MTTIEENTMFLHPNRAEVETQCGKLTDAQWNSLLTLRARWNEVEDARQHELCGPALMVHFGNIWIGIEQDGYAHS